MHCRPASNFVACNKATSKSACASCNESRHPCSRGDWRSSSRVGSASGRARNADEQTLVELRRSLADQEGIFSDDSPNLAILRARIAELEKRRSGPPSGTQDLSQRSDLSPDLRVQAADLEGQLAFIEEEQVSTRRTLVDMARSIADTEMNATRLNALERTYENAQTQYNGAVTRLAEASTGQRIEAEAVGQKLSLIEPAVAPSKPILPRRGPIAAGALGAGIGLGLGLITLLEFGIRAYAPDGSRTGVRWTTIRYHPVHIKRHGRTHAQGSGSRPDPCHWRHHRFHARA